VDEQSLDDSRERRDVTRELFDAGRVTAERGHPGGLPVNGQRVRV
jgi:hypothetical protein